MRWQVWPWSDKLSSLVQIGRRIAAELGENLQKNAKLVG